ncbi:MAG: lipid-A-disaccharide synthase [Planctomycetota bacterium]
MDRTRGLRIFFSAGEPSGDLHAANLIRALRAEHPGLEAVGLGGPHMQSAGCTLLADLTSLAVMWFGRALLHLHKFWNLASRADRYFRHQKPDALVMVDFPGFHWWLAWRAKVHGIPVFYYTPPQVWAWAQWRVKKMRRLTDHVLCALPFEQEWFAAHGCNATFVGHPFFDEVRRHPYDEAFVAQHTHRPGPLVLILPGSRTQEVHDNLRWFLKATAKVRAAVPEARFAMACYKPHHADHARAAVAAAGLPIEVFHGKTPELIRLADCCMAVSGSVSLELLHHTKPTVIHYWISPLAYFVQGLFRKVKYITLVNLLTAKELFPKDLTPYDPGQPGAERVLFPEYLTCEDRSDAIAGHIVEWLTNPDLRNRRVEALQELRTRVAHGGASRRAAEYILQAMQGPARGPSAVLLPIRRRRTAAPSVGASTRAAQPA